MHMLRKTFSAKCFAQEMMLTVLMLVHEKGWLLTYNELYYYHFRNRMINLEKNHADCLDGCLECRNPICPNACSDGPEENPDYQKCRLGHWPNFRCKFWYTHLNRNETKFHCFNFWLTKLREPLYAAFSACLLDCIGDDQHCSYVCVLDYYDELKNCPCMGEF